MNFFRALCALLIIITSIPLPYNSYAKGQINHQISNAIDPVSYFVNRSHELAQIQLNLKSFKKTSIVGISGMGKTELARMHAKLHKDDYQIIWVIDCHLDLDQEFLRLVKKLNKYRNAGIPENDKTAQVDVMHYLSSKSKWLLVMDNINVGSNSKIHKFAEWQNNGHLLFCAQESTLLPEIIRLSAFNEKDVEDLSTKIIGHEDKKCSDFLYKEFAGFPILEAQGARIIKEMKIVNPQIYEEKLHHSKNKIDFNIMLALKALDPSAKALLFKIALINNQRFSVKFMSVISDSKDELDKDLHQLTKFGLIRLVSDSQIDGQIDSQIDSQIDRQIDDQGNLIYEMHNVIADSLRKMGCKVNNRFLLEKMIDQITQSIPSGIYNSHFFTTQETFNENLGVILENMQEYGCDRFSVMSFNTHILGNCLMLDQYILKSDFYNAEKMIEWFTKRYERGDFDKRLLTYVEKKACAKYLTLSGSYHRKRYSNHHKALSYFKAASKLYDVVDTESYEYLNLLYMTGLSLISLGEIAEAQEIKEKMEKLIKGSSTNGIDATILNRLMTKLTFYQGKYEDAMSYINKTTEVIKVNKIDEDSLTLCALYHYKAKTLNATGKYEEADRVINKLLDMNKPIEKNDHLIYIHLYSQKAKAQHGMFLDANKASRIHTKTPDLVNLRAAKNLTLLHSALSNINLSLSSLLLDTSRREGNAEYFDEELALIYSIKGDILFTSGKVSEAFDLYSKASMIYFHLFKEGRKDIEFVSDNYRQAAKASCIMKDDFNYRTFTENQILDFGFKHKNTQEILDFCKVASNTL